MKLGSNKNKYGTAKTKRKVNWRIVGMSMATAILVASVYQFGILKLNANKVRTDTIKEITNSKGEYVKVFVLRKDIEKGSDIKDEDIIQITENSKLVPKNYIQTKEQLKGMVTRINLTSNTVVTNDMIVKIDDKITDPIKNQDFDWIKVHAFLKKDNYVDIHLKKKDGSDFIVVSKKKVDNLNGNIFSINIDEEERAYINNATVDAALTEGVLYTTIYPDPQNQAPAAVTYEINSNIKKMIENNPNVIKEASEKIKNRNSDNTTENDKKEESQPKNSAKPQFIEGGK